MSIKYKIALWLKRKMKIRSWERYKQITKRKVEQKFYKHRYSTGDIISLMKSMGLKKGKTVFVHSAWDEFYNYTGTINEFIDTILAEIGPNGTLAMPAYPLLLKPDSVFRINRTPTEAGLIAETFRNYPGVKRSADRHSVCALGPKSDYLLNEHQYSLTCWDEKSPYYKLAELDALVFSFGLGKYFMGGTMIHCVESILKDEVPYFASFFTRKATLKIEMENKTIFVKENYEHEKDFLRYYSNRSIEKYNKHFEKSKYARTKISNLSVNMYEAGYFIHKAISLGRKGIVHYKTPFPSKHLFNHHNKKT